MRKIVVVLDVDDNRLNQGDHEVETELGWLEESGISSDRIIDDPNVVQRVISLIDGLKERKGA
jgi:hypothetical protein